MFRFGEFWDKDGDVGITNKDASTVDDDTSSTVSSESSSNPDDISKNVKWCLKYLMLIFTGGLALSLLIIILMMSGNNGTGGAPRAIVFVFEGLKGTTFQQLVMEQGRAPHIKALITQGGSYAPCLSTSDSRCARTQSGAALGGTFSWSSAPGVASILSGVNSNRHGVANNSFASLANYAETSTRFPSFVKILRDEGTRTVAVGSSSLLTSIGQESGKCTDLGVLDFECGVEAYQRCLRSESCNLDLRLITDPKDEPGEEEDMMAEDFINIFEEGSADLLIVHLNRLNTIAKDPSQPDATFSEDSLPYAAELYYIDALVGQLMTLVRSRSFHFKENWLVVGTSDHGGLGKTNGLNNGDDEIVPFFVSTQTSFGQMKLDSPVVPTTQYDVAPTVLKWFGFSEDKVAELGFDGVPQCICGNGKRPRNCTDASINP